MIAEFTSGFDVFSALLILKKMVRVVEKGEKKICHKHTHHYFQNVLKFAQIIIYFEKLTIKV